VKFREPDPGQLALVSHQARILTKGDKLTKGEAERALSLVYRTVMSWLPGADDKMAVEDMIADGDTVIEDVLRSLLSAANEARESEAGEEKPVVRRGRPRKRA
jgi:hypothetical protein